MHASSSVWLRHARDLMQHGTEWPTEFLPVAICSASVSSSLHATRTIGASSQSSGCASTMFSRKSRNYNSNCMNQECVFIPDVSSKLPTYLSLEALLTSSDVFFAGLLPTVHFDSCVKFNSLFDQHLVYQLGGFNRKWYTVWSEIECEYENSSWLKTGCFPGVKHPYTHHIPPVWWISS